MQSSIFLARIIGPLFMILSVGLLINTKTYQEISKEFYINASQRYLGGLVALILGLLMIEFHNVWKVHWTVIITIIGWIAVVKGVVLLAFPDLLSRLADAYTNKPRLLIVNSFIVLVIGIFLTVKGYWG